jgi:hypothetical protein
MPSVFQRHCFLVRPYRHSAFHRYNEGVIALRRYSVRSFFNSSNSALVISPFAYRFFAMAKAASRPRTLLFLAAFGPGIITMIADNDAGGISTYAQTGAKTGFNLLWAFIILVPMAYYVHRASAAQLNAWKPILRMISP